MKHTLCERSSISDAPIIARSSADNRRLDAVETVANADESSCDSCLRFAADFQVVITQRDQEQSFRTCGDCALFALDAPGSVTILALTGPVPFTLTEGGIAALGRLDLTRG